MFIYYVFVTEYSWVRGIRLEVPGDVTLSSNYRRVQKGWKCQESCGLKGDGHKGFNWYGCKSGMRHLVTKGGVTQLPRTSSGPRRVF